MGKLQTIASSLAFQMYGVRGGDAGPPASACVPTLTLLLLLLMTAGVTQAARLPSHTSGYEAALERLLSQLSAHKRVLPSEFNNCQQEEPFPCKSVTECISLKLVCDGKDDCSDGWDEDDSVCTAYQRLPVSDFEELLASEARWMVPAFFAGVVNNADDLKKMAHLLVVSHTAEEFANRAQPAGDSSKNLVNALLAVRNSEPETLFQLGMPASSWDNIKYAFGSLLASGFL